MFVANTGKLIIIASIILLGIPSLHEGNTYKSIIFKSSGTGNYTPPRIYDPTATTDNLIEASIANDGFKNPFTTNIALYGNSGGSINGNNYNIPMRNGDGMSLDASDQDFIVIIRYKNDPTPVTNINITIA